MLKIAYLSGDWSLHDKLLKLVASDTSLSPDALLQGRGGVGPAGRL